MTLWRRIIDKGFTQGGTAIDKISDFTFAEGGPIKKDKLWFFATARDIRTNNKIANTVQDDGSQGIDDQYIRSALTRLTWQMSPRNKLAGYYGRLNKYRGHDMQSRYDPEKVDKDERLGRLHIRMVLVGDYEGFRRFIYEFESSPEFVILDNFTMTQSDPAKPLVLTLEMSTYYRSGEHGN